MAVILLMIFLQYWLVDEEKVEISSSSPLPAVISRMRLAHGAF